MEGEPLDISRLLYTSEGKPRISILSVAHLSDAERMFFVTILLNEVVSWMRSQPGTGSLRAILYMDEIFGYFPPTANPPSKTPMLTLLKQARAYGLGVVLATQNPVDLDYKGLANTGTWFIGRLQTERDKGRLLDGLESAAAGARFDRRQVERVLSSLDSRVFFMNNVHEDAPVLFHTRWALSYLRGPLTRTQIKTLMAPRKARTPASPTHVDEVPEAQTPKTPARSPAADTSDATATPPSLPPGISQGFLAVARSVPPGGRLHYEPALVGVGKLHYERKSAKVDEWKSVALMVPLDEPIAADPWDDADSLTTDGLDIETERDERGRFAPLPPVASRKTNYAQWRRGFVQYVYRRLAGTVLRCRALKQYSGLNESEADFRVRLRHLLHEKRDMQIEKLRKRYAPKLSALEDRVRRAEQRVSREQSQMQQRGYQTVVSLGTTILGALFGRKKASAGTIGRAATTLRTAGRTARERGDVARAKDNLEALKQRLVDLEEEFDRDIAEVRESADIDALEFEEITVRPRKSDVAVGTCGLVWLPYIAADDGTVVPAYSA
jgi:hypothetical protein